MKYLTYLPTRALVQGPTYAPLAILPNLRKEGRVGLDGINLSTLLLPPCKSEVGTSGAELVESHEFQKDSHSSPSFLSEKYEILHNLPKKAGLIPKKTGFT